VNRRRTHKLVGISRAKLKKLITYAKSAGLKPRARGWLIREAIGQARTIINGKSLEFDPRSIERTIEATNKLSHELASLSDHVRQLYPQYLSPEARGSARSVEEIKSDLESLSAGLERMLDRLKPSQGRPKSSVIEDYIFACALRWQQAGGNPGRRTPSWKKRVGFGQKKDRGPFGKFLRQAFETAGGDPSQITEAKIKDGVKRLKHLMEKNTH